MLVPSVFISNAVLNPTLELYMNSVFEAAKHTFVHHLKIRGENICPNLNKGSMWKFNHVAVEKKLRSSAQIKLWWVVMSLITLNSIKVVAPALR